MTDRVAQAIEQAVERYGESARPLITSALIWLESQEPSWHLNTPMDWDAYLEDLMAHRADSA
jgi:hypothetical protein